MATLLINVSGGVLSLPTLKLKMKHGDRAEFPLKADELKALCPELSVFEKRGRILVSEDAEVVAEEPKLAPAPPATEPPATEPESKSEPAPEPEPLPELKAEDLSSDMDAGESASSDQSDSKVE